MAIKPNAQGIVYAGETDGHKLSLAYYPRGVYGRLPTPSECKRLDDIGEKHRWNLHATIGGNDRCRDIQRNNLWNCRQGWRHLFEIHSLPNEPLDIPAYWIAKHLREGASKIRDSNACLPKGLIKFLQVFGWLLIVGMVVLNIVLYFIPGFQGLAVGWQMLIIITISALSSAFAQIPSWAMKVQLTNFTLSLKEAYKDFSSNISATNEKIRKRNNQISNMLIYQPSAMFAGGNAYEMGKAGSQTFSPSIAYDANKALLGTGSISEIDELCQNRAQVNLAGGVNFISNLLGFDFPLAQIQIYDLQREQVKLNAQVKEWQLRINSFVRALAEQGFWLGTSEEPTMQEMYDRLINTHIKRRQKYFCTISAFDKLKNYNKGLRFELPTTMADFGYGNNTRAKFLANFNQYYQQYENGRDKYITPLNQALDFVDFATNCLKQIVAFKNDDDKTLIFNRNSMDIINAKLRHSRDSVFSWRLEKIPKGDEYTTNYYVTPAQSEKIPSFCKNNVFVIWGFYYRDIPLILEYDYNEYPFFMGGDKYGLLSKDTDSGSG